MYFWPAKFSTNELTSFSQVTSDNYSNNLLKVKFENKRANDDLNVYTLNDIQSASDSDLEAHKNEVVSFIIDQYFKNVHGLNHSLNLYKKKSLDNEVILDSPGERIFNAIDLIAKENVDESLEEDINTYKRVLSAVESVDSEMIKGSSLLSEYILSPSIFEKLYNVYFRSDDFIIDIDRTTATTTGSNKITKLKKENSLEEFVNSRGEKGHRLKQGNTHSFEMDKYSVEVEAI